MRNDNFANQQIVTNLLSSQLKMFFCAISAMSWLPGVVIVKFAYKSEQKNKTQGSMNEKTNEKHFH